MCSTRKVIIRIFLPGQPSPGEAQPVVPGERVAMAVPKKNLKIII